MKTLRSLREKIEKLKSEKTHLLEEVEKLRKVGEEKIRVLEEEVSTLRMEVESMKELLGGANPSMKVKKSPWTALFPCPVVLVTCVDSNGKANIITLAWAGAVCSDPPTLALGIRPHRYSYGLIEDSGEFVVNIPNKDILREVDYCGMVSGEDVDKFSETGLTLEPAEKVKPPLIRECPVNIECVVRKKIPLGVHHLFFGEVVRVHVDQNILNEKKRIDFTKISPFVYNQGEYWSLHQKIGMHGFSKPTAAEENLKQLPPPPDEHAHELKIEKTSQTS